VYRGDRLGLRTADSEQPADHLERRARAQYG
jgi:hypothetical protein